MGESCAFVYCQANYIQEVVWLFRIKYCSTKTLFIMFKINEYFDGKVKSIAFETTATPATLGVMAAGSYEF